MKTWLILDCNFLCYRAFFSTGGLSHQGDPTGVVYGFLRDIKSFQDRFAVYDRLVLAWDHGKGLREKACPGYKESRRKRKLTEEQEIALQGMKNQVKKLKTEIIPQLGLVNNFYQDGYEADDVIASVVNSTVGHRRIIISADHDLYQLLNPKVSIFNPAANTMVTKKSFEEKYGVKPSQWVMVKSIAGCGSDDIPGVDGVGEKTACQFLAGLLPTGKKAEAIGKAEKLIHDNRKLVTLPYKGCKSFIPIKSKIDDGAWKDTMGELGISSLGNSASRGYVTPGFGLRK